MWSHALDSVHQRRVPLVLFHLIVRLGVILIYRMRQKALHAYRSGQMYQLHVHLYMTSCRLHDAHVFVETLTDDWINPNKIGALFNGFVSKRLHQGSVCLRHRLLIVHEELLLIEGPLGRHGTVYTSLTVINFTP